MSLVSEILSVIREYAHPRMRRYVQMPASFPFHYIEYNAKVGACWLRLYRSADSHKVIAVATDLTCRLHCAASLTQAIEIVATEIAARFDYMPWEFQLIEHYDWRGTRSGTDMGDYTEHFHLVDFEWSERDQEFHTPRWKLIPKEEVAQQIQGSLRDERLDYILRINWESLLAGTKSPTEASPIGS